MRSLVVFGRGGPRGPPSRPRYLSQPPPKLSYSTKSILRGNPFEILASIPEKSHVEVSTESQSSNDSYSVVHESGKIPDSYSSKTTPKCLKSLQLVAPEPDQKILNEPTDEYTKIVRGRERSKYFHKKIKQSRNFTQKLKESFIVKQTNLPHLPTAISVASQSLPMQDLEDKPSPSILDLPHMEVDDTMTQDKVNDRPDTYEFDLTPEEEQALINHDMSPPTKLPSPSSLHKSLSANTVKPDIKRFFTTKSGTNIPSVPDIPPAMATLK